MCEKKVSQSCVYFGLLIVFLFFAICALSVRAMREMVKQAKEIAVGSFLFTCLLYFI